MKREGKILQLLNDTLKGIKTEVQISSRHDVPIIKGEHDTAELIANTDANHNNCSEFIPADIFLFDANNRTCFYF